ncbi:hypothetical protein GA0070624_2715 [Micromonospora rhizosphaerae]|uniref:Uncharacterized protein n=1 Tax=Micromonospora rhizosphaerae TaxID=568872 RepID=A0A1C6S1G3_9ACTN|nr:hypothetical protein [Micromonospora rhizosphaerae]SCL23320.1 hypothetical protein GA0070624_2715 [Micromonospora rhizosphaerae]
MVTAGMADPVSSVAYAIEAALRAPNGYLSLLLPTMCLVLGLIALVILNYGCGYGQVGPAEPPGTPEALRHPAERKNAQPWAEAVKRGRHVSDTGEEALNRKRARSQTLVAVPPRRSGP